MRSSPLAFCSISALDRDLAAAARAALAAGCSAIEATARPPHVDPDAGPDAAARQAEAVRREGATIVAYGSYLGRGGRTTSAQAAADVAIAQALGAPRIRVWAEGPGAEGGVPFDACVALLQETAELAGRAGIELVVERHVGSFADTPERIDALLGAIGCENVALNYQVLDLLPESAIGAQADDAARLAGAARYFHLKNYRRNPSAGGPLLPGASLRSGALDYRAILPAAWRAGYAGPLTFEFLSWEARPLEEKLADDVAFVREILARAGDA